MKDIKRVLGLSLFLLGIGWAFHSFNSKSPSDAPEVTVRNGKSPTSKAFSKREPASSQRISFKDSPPQVAAKENIPVDLSPRALIEEHEREVSSEYVEEPRVSNSEGRRSLAGESFYVPSSNHNSPSQAPSFDGDSDSSAPEASSESGWGYFDIANIVDSGGADQKDKTPTQKKLAINKVRFEDGELIVDGSNLDTATSIKLVSSAGTFKLSATSKDKNRLVAQGLEYTKIIVGKVYDLIIANAYGEFSYPISVEVADRSITPNKLAPLPSSQDGYVLKWSASSSNWVASPDLMSSGTGSGGLHILRGSGLVGIGTEVLDGESLVLDLGYNANQIPFFDADRKILFSNGIENYRVGIEAGKFSISFDDDGIPAPPIFELGEDSFLVHGEQVCLKDGTNCPTPPATGVSDVSVSSPLVKTGTSQSVSVGLSYDSGTLALTSGNALTIAANAIDADKLAAMGATTDGQVLKWNAVTSKWVAGTDNDSATTETDPTVPAWAKTTTYPVCDANQTVGWILLPVPALGCVDILLESTDLSGVIVNTLAGDETTKAPSVASVNDALDLKQDIIGIATNKINLSKNTGGSTYPLIFPAGQGSNGQVLINDGSGTLSWTSLPSGTLTGITGTDPIAVTSTGATRDITLKYSTHFSVASGALNLADGAVTDAKVAAGANIAQSKIAGLATTLNGFVLKAGDTMTGDLTMSSGGRVRGLAAPALGADATNKDYVDGGMATVLSAAQTYINGVYDAAKTYVDTSVADVKTYVDATVVDVKAYVDSSFVDATTVFFNLGGNSPTSAAILGTKNNQDLALITNNQPGMLINASGNVGIGITNNLQGRLHVESTASMPVVFSRASTDNRGSELIFLKARGTATAPSQVLASDRLMGIFADGFYSNTGRSYNAGGIEILADGNFTSTSWPTAIRFGTTPVGSGNLGRKQRMLINSAGNVGIGELANDPQYQFSLGDNRSGIQVVKKTVSGVEAVEELEFFIKNRKMFSIYNKGNTLSDLGMWVGEDIMMSGDIFSEGDINLESGDFNIDVGEIVIGQGNLTMDSGNIILTGGCLYYNTTAQGTCASDKRLKNNIEDFTKGLDIINGISPVTYDFNGKLASTENLGKQTGLIAQELEKIAPEMIVREKVLLAGDTEKTEILKVNYSNLIWIAINAVKELSAMVTELLTFKSEAEVEIASLVTFKNEAKREIASLKEENTMMKEYLCEKDPQAKFCGVEEGH